MGWQPPPPSPEPFPHSKTNTTTGKNVTSDPAYLQSGPGPGHVHQQIPSSTDYTSQQYPSHPSKQYPSQQYTSSQISPNPSRRSTLATTPTYSNASLPPQPNTAPHLSGSTSYNPPPSSPVSVPVGHPSTNPSGLPPAHRSIHYDMQPQYTMHPPSRPGIMGGPQPTAQVQSSQTKDESGNKGSQERPTGERGTSLKAQVPQPTAQSQSSQTKDESGNKGSQERPTGERGTSLNEYLEMLRDKPSTRASSLAAYCLMWIALGGFLFLPGSFPKIDKILNDSRGIHSEKKDFTRYVPLYVGLGFTGFAIGAIGLFFLALHHYHNRTWLFWNIYFPGFHNGLSGLISTLVRLYARGTGVRYGPITVGALVVSSLFTFICFLAIVRHHCEVS